MIRKNPEVCFQVDELQDMANWRCVIAWGTVEELTDESQRTEALRVLAARPLPFPSSETTHLSPVWPFFSDSNDVQGIFFRILLHRKTGRFERLDPGPVFAS